MLKLEHRKQTVLPVDRFILRMIRYTMFILIMLSISVGIGIWGYRTFGHLSWLDSFHMACMILTGMGPVVEMQSDAAKIFSSFYALFSGVAFLTFTAVFFTPIVHRLLHILHFDDEALP